MGLQRRDEGEVSSVKAYLLKPPKKRTKSIITMSLSGLTYGINESLGFAPKHLGKKSAKKGISLSTFIWYHVTFPPVMSMALHEKGF